MLAAFVTYERQTNQPLFNVETLKEPTLLISLFTNFLIANVVMISLIIGPFYLTLALQLSIVETGFVMIASPVTVAMFAFLSGKLTNKINLDNLALVGITVITLGAVWMTQITATDGTIGYIIGLVIMGSGYATFTSANNTLTMLKVNSSNKGLLSGTLSLSRNLGLMIGATISSNLYSFITGLSQQAEPSPLLLSDGVNMVYFVALLALFTALSIQFFNKQTKGKNQVNTA
ncbi:MFS transporter [Pseudoalteromonas xiamenensis]|uniref:MFS transporter n=1 Tax=Pseudoalteromonas xiamenensis TaxID=882626 RepID=UPI0027E3E16D|nr:MFS transporter [Pseudoalteromonas xiamenensis]WMN59564.1 MFS transporter [Pseudoalteromonas xiamenensis]